MKTVKPWVAKKLKNIYNFNECCSLYFDTVEKKIIDGYSVGCYYFNKNFINSENYTIPFVSQVMEWILREKNIFIDVRFHEEVKKFYWFLENIKTGEISYCCRKANELYEDSLENAIELLIKKDFNYDKY